MQSSSPPHRVGHNITFNPVEEAEDEERDEEEDEEEDRSSYNRLQRRRSTTTTVTTTGVDSSSDLEHSKHQLQHHPLASIRPSSRRFLGADEYYCDDDTSGGGAGVEYAVLVPDSFAVI